MSAYIVVGTPMVDHALLLGALADVARVPGASRIALANAIGMSEDKLGEVDTTLSDARHDYDEATVLTEARNARPDLKAAEADLRSAELASSAARWSRTCRATRSSGSVRPHDCSRSTRAVRSCRSAWDSRSPIISSA